MEKEINKFIVALADLADMSDDAGFVKEADAISYTLPLIATIKKAQYEGGQNYWIANSRAFEMAYKQKRMNGKTDPEKFRSPHEVWWEVLEEYQDSLLSNQADFNSKYAAAAGSIDKAAAVILLDEISRKMASGSAPSVSFYEAVESLSSGGHVYAVWRKVASALAATKEAARAAKNEAIEAKAEDLLKQAQLWDKFKGWMARGLGATDPQRLAKEIRDSKLKAQLALRKTRFPINAFEFEAVLEPFVTPLTDYLEMWKQAGGKIPPLPDAEQFAENGRLDARSAQLYVNELLKFYPLTTPEYAERLHKRLQMAKDSLSIPGAGSPAAPGTAPAAAAPSTAPAAAAAAPTATAPTTPAVKIPVTEPEIKQKIDEMFRKLTQSKGTDERIKILKEYGDWSADKVAAHGVIPAAAATPTAIPASAAAAPTAAVPAA